MEVLGDTAALTKVGLDRQPTDRETAGAIAGDGLISSVSGLFGCLPLTSFAQNIGLVAMTKVINRKVILSGGLILVWPASCRQWRKCSIPCRRPCLAAAPS